MKILAQNRKAYYNYEIIEKTESGVSLTGIEVKSIKLGHASLKESFVKIINNEAYIVNCHISQYTYSNLNSTYDPTRTRKLLLHKKEILKLSGKINEKGLSIVPLKFYLKNNLIKLEIALAKGKKFYDKRETIKRRDAQRDLAVSMKQTNRSR